MGFKDELEIDHNALDVEWLNQPQKFFSVSEEWADAKAKIENTKLTLDVVLAEAERDVRGTPEKFGLSKVTESAVKSAVTTDARVVEARKDYNTARHEADVLGAAVTAMDHRKKALENAVKLHGQQYFAGPSEPRDLDAEFLKESAKKAARKRGKRGRKRRSKRAKEEQEQEEEEEE